MTEWISVKEQLPPPYEKVLAYFDDEKGFQCVSYEPDKVIQKWRLNKMSTTYYAPIFWMPLPEAPT